MEDPLKVPLVFANFWVQIHEVPLGYFSEPLARQIGDFFGKFLEYDGANLGKRLGNHLCVRVQLDVSDSYCQGKMELRFETAEIGWDLSLRDQFRRALCNE
ncbi:hypothetical protein CXB51_009228 [Gossypium anomalum]|uniref:DUF4283 domain-containing protein n=1 Tax=Gossypium anomalum TaxID=47600 RepID=A0A8J5ZI33_9ROSI|nr:hypothetical protein CXB51_009228 [Gossypium anomalum]